MTTELEEAPTIGVAEAVETETFEEPRDMIAHLYYQDGETVAMCGIRAENDPHDQMHQAYGDGQILQSKLDPACNGCGAPMCKRCLDLAPETKER